MELDKFKNAPDILEPDEVRKLFEELLAMPKPANDESAIEITLALSEVADRQWHTYSLLDKQTMRALDNWIAVNWNPSSERMTELLIGIIANVGLPNALELMKNAVDSGLPHSVRNIISDALVRFGSSVNDPYRMHKVGLQKARQNS